MSSSPTEGCEDSEHAQWEQGKDSEESRGPTDQSPHVASSSGFAMNTGEDEETVVTSIRVTDIALGLKRVPAGFYIAVHHSGLEWRTENKPSSVNTDVEWNVPIPLPLDLSAAVHLEIYGSFEFSPMLGAGEQLRKLTITVGQLLDRSAQDVAFIFFPKDGDVVSPCSSISITVQRGKGESGDSSPSQVLSPNRSAAESQGRLGDATNRGHHALSRYRKYGIKQDLERSVEEFERALRLCPMDHPCRAAAQSNLATAKFILSRVEDTDVEVPLGLYRNALSARPVGHVDRPSTLIQLAAVHFARAEKRRDETENTRAEALLHEAMELSSTESYEHRAAALVLQLHARCRVHSVSADGRSSLEQDSASLLMDADPWFLSHHLMKRFERFGDLADLDHAIAALEVLVRSTSIWDYRYCAVLGNLGVALHCRFNHLGELKDLDDAISKHREATTMTPDGHPDKPGQLSNLGGCFADRFEGLGELGDVEDAISMLRNAVALTPDDHPEKPSRLHNLGISIFHRFDHLGELSDLEESTSMHKHAVTLTPHGDPNKAGRLNSLACTFKARFEHLGHPSDLEDAISTLKNAVDITPYDHPSKPAYLGNLGSTLEVRFKHLGEPNDLQNAILMFRDAVALTPHNHPDKATRLNQLGYAFKIRFECLGQLSDLEDAISILRHAVDITPHNHLAKAGRLNNFGNCLRARFERLGELSDLEDAISMLKHAVDRTPHGHPHSANYFNNLGYSIKIRFERFGELSDLELAISMYKDAVALTPHGNYLRANRLSNLATALLARFEYLQEPGDLDHAILRYKDAATSTPHGHPDQPSYLNNLGNAFLARFLCLGVLSDIEDATSMYLDAAELTPRGHPDQASRLQNLGSSFIARFRHLGELDDLDFAISRHKDAAALTPRDHPRKARRLHNLGNSLITRFKHLGEPSDLEDALSMFGDAVNLVPLGHYERLIYLSDLGYAFNTRFVCLLELSDLEKAITLYSLAASSPIGPISVRFDVSQRWTTLARLISHRSLFQAYSVTISLLPKLAWIGLPLTYRYAQLTRGANVVREAAAAALDAGFPEMAVEWLEQGRSIVWGELYQLRSSHDELSSAYPDHARRLRELSTALEQASATRENTLSTSLKQTPSTAHHTPESLEADRHRMLAIQRDKLLQEIRGFPGFERFLLQTQFSQLRASAHSGPVVILNAAEHRCDALIVLADVDHVIHVPLPTFTFKRSAGLQNMLVKLLGHARTTRCDDRKGDPATRGGVSWESMLSALWNGGVKSILDVLAFSIPGDLSRIFWCPTGPFVFLPIHAAGLYDIQHSQPGYKVFDFVVSSYVPTLSVLALPFSPGAQPSHDLRLLAVRQPPSDGLPRLPGAVTELEHIKAVIRKFPSARTILLESSTGTVEEVLTLMREADWVHFACHGIQDDIDSGLCLADGRRLQLQDIIALSRPRGGLAFLSACQTATGEERLSDEAIHIAAGMLFAGYGGVIGTMWSISDKLAPGVARDVYEQLFRNDTPDYREAALALHRAIRDLRDSGKASFATWLPFIHVGL